MVDQHDNLGFGSPEQSPKGPPNGGTDVPNLGKALEDLTKMVNDGTIGLKKHARRLILIKTTGLIMSFSVIGFLLVGATKAMLLYSDPLEQVVAMQKLILVILLIQSVIVVLGGIMHFMDKFATKK